MESKTLIWMLEEKGWKRVRTESSHVTFKHPEVREIITVPHPRKDLASGTLRKIQRIAGLK